MRTGLLLTAILLKLFLVLNDSKPALQQVASILEQFSGKCTSVSAVQQPVKTDLITQKACLIQKVKKQWIFS